MTRFFCFILCLAALAPISASAGETPLDVLRRAYPDAVARVDGNAIVFTDGARLDAGADDPATPFDARIAHASLRDMFHLAYPRGATLAAPAPDFDPGRFRDKAFFDRLYGDCRKGEIEARLVSVTWLPKTWGHVVKFAPRAAAALRAVSNEIDAMPQAIKRAAYPTAGTYACRGVADKGQPSMHAYGAAIDLNLAVSNYWLWDGRGKDAPAWRNRMPRAIVDAFERHGFIWGGRWDHYDTMHFEYRPELDALAR